MIDEEVPLYLETNALFEIKGGAVSLKAAILAGIAGLITFLIGVVDGYMNPLKCNMRKR